MKLRKKSQFSKLIIAASCGVISVFLDFLFIPIFAVGGVPDPIWMALMLLLPTVATVLLLNRTERIPPTYIWCGLPVQYFILCVFAKPIAKIMGVPFSGSLGGLTYVFEAVAWPLAVTSVQFCVVLWISRHKM